MAGCSDTNHARGAPYLGPSALGASRLPTEHPEGFIEAFANIYRDVAEAISQKRALPGGVPGIVDGVRGMAFVARAVEASGKGWVTLGGDTE